LNPHSIKFGYHRNDNDMLCVTKVSGNVKPYQKCVNLVIGKTLMHWCII